MSLAFDIICALLDPPPRAPGVTAAAPRSAPYRGQDRQTRIEREIMMVAPHFADRGGVYYDEANADWLLIPKYPLPARWGERWCQLLIVFGPGYPMAPPNGFYLNKRFALAAGGSDPHLTGAAFHGATDLLAQGWHWYCVQTLSSVDGGWCPSPDYRETDNLWSLLALIRESLTND